MSFFFPTPYPLEVKPSWTEPYEVPAPRYYDSTFPITVSFNYALPKIKKVIYHDPATVVLWDDGTKTIVKCQHGDKYLPETGLAMAICKKAYGNRNEYNKIFAKWLPK